MQLSHCVGVLLLSVHYGLAAFCGDSAIPFSFEVLPSGQPVLGCARPACFGWSSSGQPISETSSFYNVNGRPDGFFQPLYNSVNPFQPGDGRRYPEQSANCEASFGSNSCDESTQWVGGFAPSLNTSGSPLSMQCCTYGPLQSSTSRGVAPIHPGEIFAGGEVRENNQPVAFDYVSNIVKRVDANGGVSYDVGVKRLPCPGDPPLPLPQIAQPPPQFAQPPPQFAQPPPQFVQAPPPAPAYVPSAASYYGGGSYFCFTADALVETISGEKKRMDELKIHDWVMTARGKNVGYAPVNYWLHRVPSQKAQFIKFDLADGKSLKITAKHFIYKGKCTGNVRR
ncbi:hypothetical protein WR25_10626 [Diploscapter pachys]|uniref:Hint domain-containing protein n=1 Tax=Diploscapter pachys TaxID=2018661 RepID=A0A2A2KZX3_9BILA|nr:hypothetical protein WR25_10626 [Diploscapter pachys]